MSAGFTPAPWEFSETVCVKARDGDLIALVYSTLKSSDGGTNLDANARLIAAAPTMFEALESINRILSPGNRTLDEMLRDMGYATDVARAALAKVQS